MRFVFVLIAGLFLLHATGKCQARRNAIDSLQNYKQALSLVHSVDSQWFGFTTDTTAFPFYGYLDSNRLERNKKIRDSLGVVTFVKEDFDKNGRTDLLIHGADGKIACLMDTGERYQLISLNKDDFGDWAQPTSYASVMKSSSKSFIVFYHIEGTRYPFDYLASVSSADTLTYKFGSFIEWHATPSIHLIQKIDFSEKNYYNPVPVFSMSIDSTGFAQLEAKSNCAKEGTSEEIVGKFHILLKPDQYQQVFSLLNYLDFLSLRENYSSFPWDLSTAYLTIIYDNGQKKTIEDYGLSGTFGLSYLYDLLFHIAFSYEWIRD